MFGKTSLKGFLNRVKEAVKYLNKMTLLKVFIYVLELKKSLRIPTFFANCEYKRPCQLQREIYMQGLWFCKKCIHKKRYDNFNGVFFK